MATFTSKVSVDMTSTKPINRNILGNNIQWKDNADGIFNSSATAYVNNSISPLKQLPVNILRYPGGTLADAYNWCNGVGDLNSRRNCQVDPTNPSYVQAVNVGTSEFLTLCVTLKAEPLITVNTLTGTAQDAADWVNYVNNRVNYCGSCWVDVIGASTQLPRCRYWEIGNEPYLEAGFGQTSQTPSQYAAIAKNFINQMKAADSTILTGIPLRNDYYAGSNIAVIPGQNFGWNNTVLQYLKNNGITPDYVSIHNSYLPYFLGVTPPSDNDFFLALMAGTNAITKDINVTRNQLKSIFPSKIVPMAITEYNSLFMMTPPADDYIETLASGLFIADFLLMCARMDDILMANFWSLAGNWFFGTIDGSYNKRSAFYVLDMLDTFFSGRSVKTTNNVPNFTNPAVGIIPSYSNNPKATVMASTETVPNGVRVSYAIINKSPTDNCNLEISYSNRTVGTSGRRRQTLGSINSISAIEYYDNNFLSTTASPKAVSVAAGDPIKVTVKKNSILRIDAVYNIKLV